MLPIRIINAMREMNLRRDIDLEQLHTHLPDSVYHRGRPQMLVIRMSNGRNLQIFRCGKIQVLGNLSHFVMQSMCYEVVKKMRTLMPHLRLSPLTLKNIVVSVQLKMLVNLANIKTSNHCIFYETELFPAALIRKWHPVHIAVFHNGHCIMTGLRDISKVADIVKSLMRYLYESQLIESC